MAPIEPHVLIKAFSRVLIATFCTVAAMIAVGYLVKSLGLNPSLIIPLSITTGICGFVFGVYWTMTYLAKSGYPTKK
jgi:uncharacterized membrane protein